MNRSRDVPLTSALGTTRLLIPNLKAASMNDSFPKLRCIESLMPGDIFCTAVGEFGLVVLHEITESSAISGASTRVILCDFDSGLTHISAGTQVELVEPARAASAYEVLAPRLAAECLTSTAMLADIRRYAITAFDTHELDQKILDDFLTLLKMEPRVRNYRVSFCLTGDCIARAQNTAQAEADVCERLSPRFGSVLSVDDAHHQPSITSIDVLHVGVQDSEIHIGYRIIGDYVTTATNGVAARMFARQYISVSLDDTVHSYGSRELQVRDVQLCP